MQCGLLVSAGSTQPRTPGTLPKSLLACDRQLDKAWGCKPFSHFFTCPITQAARPSSEEGLTGSQKKRSHSELTDKKTLPYPWALQPPGLWGGWRQDCISAGPHQSVLGEVCRQSLGGKDRPYSSRPQTSNPCRIPKTCPWPLAPMQPMPGQCGDTDRLGASQRRNQSPDS